MEKLSFLGNFLLLLESFLQYGWGYMLVGLRIFLFSVALESLYTALGGICSTSHIRKCEKYIVANIFALDNEKLQSAMNGCACMFVYSPNNSNIAVLLNIE